MTIDERLAKHFGLCWHKTEYIKGIGYRCIYCHKVKGMLSPLPRPNFTAQIVVDGEPQSLLVHHLRLSGELHSVVMHVSAQIDGLAYSVSGLGLGVTVQYFTMRDLSDMVLDILLTPTLFKQAVGAYLDCKEAKG